MHNHEHAFFANLHINENPSCLTHERTIQACMSLGTRYTPASVSDMQVTRVHAGKNSYMQVCSRLSTVAHGIVVGSITTSLLYLLAVTYHAFH